MLQFMTVLISLARLAPSHAWGGFGHKIVAKIATDPQLLSPNALAYILEHFPETESRLACDALVPIADWADEVTASDAYHFTNTPYRNCQPFVLERDCGFGTTQGQCLSTGIELYFNRATDLSLSLQDRREAIMFLVHFVADASQPLHTGFREDAGGNGIHLTNPANMSLHQLWDYGILDAHRESKRGVTWEAIADNLISKAKDKVEAFGLSDDVVATNSFANVMITDTVMSTTCNLAYKTGNAAVNAWIEDGDEVDSMYMLTRQATVLNQLQKAGIRLAQVLNWLAQIHGSHVHEARRARSELPRSGTTVSPLEDEDAFVVGPGYFAPLFSNQVYLPESSMAGAGDSVSIAACPPRPARPAAIMHGPVDTGDAYLERTLAGRERVSMMGVQLDELALMTRKGVLILTYRALAADPSYFPTHTRSHTPPAGGPAGGMPGIHLDSRVFGHLENIPASLLQAALIFIEEGRVISPLEHVDGYVGGLHIPIGLEFASMESTRAAEALAESLGPYPPITRVPTDDKLLLRSESKLVLLQRETHWFLSRSDFLKPDPAVRRITFSANRIAIKKEPVYSVMLLIDIRLFNIRVTHAVLDLIRRMSRHRATKEFSTQTLATNLKLLVAFAQFGVSPLGGLSTPIGDGVPSALLASLEGHNRDNPDVGIIDFILNPDFEFQPEAHMRFLRRVTQ